MIATQVSCYVCSFLCYDFDIVNYFKLWNCQIAVLKFIVWILGISLKYKS